MIDMLAAIAICAVTVGYWVLCGKISLKYQARAARSLKLFFNRKSVSVEVKEEAHYAYIALRHWPTLLLLALIFPIIIFSYAFGKQRKISVKYSRAEKRYLLAVFPLLIKMYASKYPITTTILVTVLTLVCTVIIVSALLMDKLFKQHNSSLMLVLTIINFLGSSMSAFTIKRRHAN
ncbi:hypothetical protein FNH88_19045 [Salmonella enterica subsp. salamae]|nr:hypothetical protein [Salmonella enterica subsp. salamae]